MIYTEASMRDTRYAQQVSQNQLLAPLRNTMASLTVPGTVIFATSDDEFKRIACRHVQSHLVILYDDTDFVDMIRKLCVDGSMTRVLAAHVKDVPTVTAQLTANGQHATPLIARMYRMTLIRLLPPEAIRSPGSIVKFMISPRQWRGLAYE
jgi:hypothetical protein